MFSACGRSKKVYKTTEDRTLIKTIKELDKNPDNAELKAALNDLYKQAAQSHLNKIDVYNTSNGLEKWDKLLVEYNALRSVSETVNSSPTAQRILNIPSYIKEIEVTKQNAASAYYDTAVVEMNQNTRDFYRAAWYDFKKADSYVPGFKDARAQMGVAFQKGTVYVVIDPVTDNSPYYSTLGFNRYGNSFNSDMFQRNLVRDLSYNKSLPALFYTDWEAMSNHIKPDWTVDLAWQNLDIPRPYTKQYNRNVSSQVEMGRDTSGKTIYQTVNAVLYITKRYFTATGDIELRITDQGSRQILISQRFTKSYDWKLETATYSGDSRALSKTDWDLVNNKSWQMPPPTEILDEIQKRIYPDVKNRIYSAVRW